MKTWSGSLLRRADRGRLPLRVLRVLSRGLHWLAGLLSQWAEALAAPSGRAGLGVGWDQTETFAQPPSADRFRGAPKAWRKAVAEIDSGLLDGAGWTASAGMAAPSASPDARPVPRLGGVIRRGVPQFSFPSERADEAASGAPRREEEPAEPAGSASIGGTVAAAVPLAASQPVMPSAPGSGEAGEGPRDGGDLRGAPRAPRDATLLTDPTKPTAQAVPLARSRIGFFEPGSAPEAEGWERALPSLRRKGGSNEGEGAGALSTPAQPQSPAPDLMPKAEQAARTLARAPEPAQPLPRAAGPRPAEALSSGASAALPAARPHSASGRPDLPSLASSGAPYSPPDAFPEARRWPPLPSLRRVPPNGKAGRGLKDDFSARGDREAGGDAWNA
ncbi:MAG: hypothetical protein AAF841_04000 [Pseudomonadota bacterium]